MKHFLVQLAILILLQTVSGSVCFGQTIIQGGVIVSPYPAGTVIINRAPTIVSNGPVYVPSTQPVDNSTPTVIVNGAPTVINGAPTVINGAPSVVSGDPIYQPGISTDGSIVSSGVITTGPNYISGSPGVISGPNYSPTIVQQGIPNYRPGIIGSSGMFSPNGRPTVTSGSGANSSSTVYQMGTNGQIYQVIGGHRVQVGTASPRIHPSRP